MDSINKYHNIAKLIFKKSKNKISEAENQSLENWLNINNNQRIYNSIINKTSDNFIYDDISTEKALNKYYNKYRTKRINYRRIISVAASLLIVFSSITFWFLNKDVETNKYASIHPGEPKATLILNNGDTISLNASQIPELIKEEDKTIIKTSTEQICYKASEASVDIKPQEIYNTLQIPKGGEFRLTLADGTIIWINSETTLKYPVNMVASARNIWLKGEAYFKVTKNINKPFIVHTDKVNVKVLGTEFNVKSYNDDKYTQTVLVEGSVSMKTAEESSTEEIILKPGFMGYIAHNETDIKTKEVETYLHTSWINSQFAFEKESLENILKILSRWYNLEIVYENNSAKNQKYTLDVKRHESIGTILNAFEATNNVKFSVDGHKITVK